MAQLTAEQTSRLTEAFCFFDKDEDGLLTAKEVGVAMRSAGENAPDEEIQEMMKANGRETVDLNGFLQMMEARNVDEKKAEDDLMTAFRFLDRGQTGSIYVGELRHLLTSVGEKLSGEEFDEWVDQDSDCDANGRINLQTLINKLISISSK